MTNWSKLELTSGLKRWPPEYGGGGVPGGVSYLGLILPAANASAEVSSTKSVRLDGLERVLSCLGANNDDELKLCKKERIVMS